MDTALQDFEVPAVRARHVTRLIRTVEDFAAPSGTSANSCDRRRYAFGHVICADADALQARPPEAVVAILGPGHFFGEGCLNGHPLRIATTRAVDECVITRLEKATMIATIHNEPEFSELFMSYLLTRNSRIEEDLIDQLFNSSEKRLARLLLLLANFGKEGRPEPVAGRFSQETLAEMIGTTRSRVSFFMNKFRKLGFIEYNGKLEVHNSLLNMVLRDKPEIKTRDKLIDAE
jgi:CRP/FNR family cyclic AMP-dependent transcriptional regulator